MIQATVMEAAVVGGLRCPFDWVSDVTLVRITDGQTVTYIPLAMWNEWSEHQEGLAMTLLRIIREG